ncbi:MAG: DUF1566 domain-containing protein, partial [Hyphomicrobiales bacterium]|nr:DUF1566 domain-containing protein [Hyphomicrobiales bacterium]
SVDFTTGVLPETPPTVSVTTSTSQSAGGITFLGSGPGQNESSLYWGFDEEGEVVWYLHGDYTAASSPVIRVVEPGVMLVFLRNSIRTITTEGETIAEYIVGRYHHEAKLLPNGNTLVLATETMDSGDDTLAGDNIKEMDAAGNIVWEWSSFDHLDITRFPSALATSETMSGALDWSHSNALFYIEEDDAVILSSRSQSWVVKIDRATGNIMWIMGDSSGMDASYQYNDKFLTLTTGTWTANQHAPMMAEAGEVLIYDNRNETGGAADMSRVVKFSIDEAAMTATQTWEAIAPKYTSSLGDVDELSNGNVMMCAGGPGSESLAYITEVTSDSPAETVWSMSVDNTVYRAERMSWESFLNNSGSSGGGGVTPAKSYAIVDTGQTNCYGTSRKIPVTCPAEGESLYGQDAHYQGNQASYQDNGDGTVTDLQTGLIWQQVQPDGRYTWTDAKTYAENLTLGGYSDWRLPTIKELYSLALFSGDCYASPISIPYLDTEFFSYTFPEDVEGSDLRAEDGQYITSTEYVGITMGRDSSTFGFNFADGRIKSYPNGGSGPDMPAFVRCIRGDGTYGQNDYEDNGDDTITDKATGLMWTKFDSSITMNWEDALSYAENLEHGRYSDWRLPNTKELQSIVDYSKAPDATDSANTGAAIDSIFDLTTIESWFWTGTTLNDDGGGIYICFGQASAYDSTAGDFSINAHGAGAQRSDPKTGEPSDYPEGHGPQKDEIRIYNYVRCVRDAL